MQEELTEHLRDYDRSSGGGTFARALATKPAKGRPNSNSIHPETEGYTERNPYLIAAAEQLKRKQEAQERMSALRRFTIAPTPAPAPAPAPAPKPKPKPTPVRAPAPVRAALKKRRLAIAVILAVLSGQRLWTHRALLSETDPVKRQKQLDDLGFLDNKIMRVALWAKRMVGYDAAAAAV